MNVGDSALFYPGNECDRDLVAESGRGGCAAIVIGLSKENPAGHVDLKVSPRDGDDFKRYHVPVIYPPEYDPPHPPEEVDPPHHDPYCRPKP